MRRTIRVGKKNIALKASALVPRLYRYKFGRDLVADMNQLRKAYKKAEKAVADSSSEEEKQDAQLSVMDLTIFENVAYIMAKHADPNVPKEPDEWLDTIPGVFSVYEILPVILEMWDANKQTTSIPVKK